jgi:hypothetical protein
VLARLSCGPNSRAQLDGLAFLVVKYCKFFMIDWVYTKKARMSPAHRSNTHYHAE